MTPPPLSWFTELDAAIAHATRRNRPILSLRLLGRLDEELSCANSRFFRRTLYLDPTIAATLRDRFVLHWRSLRPVPLVTIDLRDGRRFTKPITGNSTHLVLDPRGRPVDALPGLFDVATFRALLEQALGFAALDRRDLAAAHRRALDRPPPPPPPPSRAVAASLLAPTKHVVEAPLLHALVPPDVARDTQTNLGLRAQVHAAFAAGFDPSIDQLVDWLYRELFLMPLDDPFLGLDVPDPVTAPS